MDAMQCARSPSSARMWRVAVSPLEHGWSIAQVHLLGGALPDERQELAQVDAADAPSVIAAHVRALQLLVRNAACGTPVGPAAMRRQP